MNILKSRFIAKLSGTNSNEIVVEYWSLYFFSFTESYAYDCYLSKTLLIRSVDFKCK